MTEQNFDPAHTNMNRHLISGILNSGMVQAVKILCQFGSIILVSRLLPPSDFGLIAMVSPIYGFVALFLDLGFSQATIQKQVVTQDEINLFFWINMAAGAVLTVLVVAISPLVGWYYNDPRVVPLTAAMGILILVGAAGNQPCAILMRRMQFKALALTGAMGAVAGLMVSLISALIMKSYWALYLGMVAATVVPIIGAWIATGWKPSLPRRVSGMRDMLKFGAGITTANVSSFFSRNLDNVLIGWRWGGESLGLYDRAYKLLLFPIQQIVAPVINPLVPLLSRLIDEPERYRSILVKTLSQLTLAIWPGIIWAIILADTLVPTLLGKQWVGAEPIFVPLAIAGLVQTINYSAGCMYISQGRSGEFARWSFIGAVVDVASFTIGLPYGAVGVATAYAISEYLRTPFCWWNLTRIGPVRARDVIHAIVPQIVSTLISVLALLAYRHMVELPPFALLAGGLVLSYLTTALAMGVSRNGRKTLKHSLEAVHRVSLHIQTRHTP